MSQRVLGEQRKQLMANVEETHRRIHINRRIYNIIRLTTRISKVVAAVLTSVAAVLTSVTGSSWSAWVTAGAGVLTAIIEVLSREFEAEMMRAHYYVYDLEFRQLLERIDLESEIDDELSKKYLDEFHELEKQEARARPTLNIMPGG